MSKLVPSQGYTPYLILALPVAGLVVFLGAPALGAFAMSLQRYTHLYQPQWVGLGNYVALAQNPQFLGALWHTAQLVFIVVPSLVVLALLLALLLNQKLPGIAVFRALIYLPVVTSLVVAGIVWKWLLAENGLFNQALLGLGLSPIPWLTDPGWVLWAIALVVVWKALPYYAMIYLSQLQSLNQQLYDAAAIDGAPRWLQHWHITLPAMRPGMALVGLVALIGTLKVFTEIYVMTRGGPLHASETLVYLIYQWAFERLDLGLACAAGLLLALLLMVVSVVQLVVSRHNAAQAAMGGGHGQG